MVSAHYSSPLYYLSSLCWILGAMQLCFISGRTPMLNINSHKPDALDTPFNLWIVAPGVSILIMLWNCIHFW